MSSTSYDDAGKLVLRLTLGVLLLMHGVAKLFSGVGFIEGMLAARGLPAFLAYGVYLGEILAPVLLLLGLYTRVAALVVVVNMLFAILLVHMSDLFAMTKTGAWALELQGLFLFAAVAVALLGAGRYSIAGAEGRFN